MKLDVGYFEKLHAQAHRTESFLRLGMPSAKQLEKDLRNEIRVSILEPLRKNESRLGREFCKRMLTEYDPSEKRFLEYCAREALVARMQKWLRKLDALSRVPMGEETKGHFLSFARAVWKISSGIACDEIQVRRIVSGPPTLLLAKPEKRPPLRLVHSK